MNPAIQLRPESQVLPLLNDSEPPLTDFPVEAQLELFGRYDDGLSWHEAGRGYLLERRPRPK